MLNLFAASRASLELANPDGHKGASERSGSGTQVGMTTFMSRIVIGVDPHRLQKPEMLAAYCRPMGVEGKHVLGDCPAVEKANPETLGAQGG